MDFINRRHNKQTGELPRHRGLGGLCSLRNTNLDEGEGSKLGSDTSSFGSGKARERSTSSSRKNEKAFRLVKLVDISSRKNEASSSKAGLLLHLLFSPSKAGFGKEMTSTRLRTFDFIRMWRHL